MLTGSQIESERSLFMSVDFRYVKYRVDFGI